MPEGRASNSSTEGYREAPTFDVAGLQSSKGFTNSGGTGLVWQVHHGSATISFSAFQVMRNLCMRDSTCEADFV
jgi:hypothetical protein